MFFALMSRNVKYLIRIQINDEISEKVCWFVKFWKKMFKSKLDSCQKFSIKKLSKTGMLWEKNRYYH